MQSVDEAGFEVKLNSLLPAFAESVPSKALMVVGNMLQLSKVRKVLLYGLHETRGG